ncbi:hypothetical protein Scep_030210 [Stephania cephalantha]|uniref:Tf2-1-like SH3-like domain-containing protein n=1 Tax=Stephania cephalantha TaxID=152367 RepID=A0AAP0E6U9_9MAGN
MWHGLVTCPATWRCPVCLEIWGRHRMPPFEALYGRLYRSSACWAKPEEVATVGPEIIVDHTEKVRVIRHRSQAAHDRQNKYVNKYHDELSYEVDDWVYLKVSPCKGHQRFWIKGKLASRFIGPFQIVRRVGEVAYQLRLSNQLAGVHDVFHISMLRLARSRLRSMVDMARIDVRPDVTYE